MTDSRLIVALDTENSASAQKLVDRFGSRVGFYKIGLGLLHDDGIGLARRIRQPGTGVMLDLKLFDTPDTIERAVRALVNDPAPDFLTVQGDPQVVAAAVKGKGDYRTRILAVTLLTSMDTKDLDDLVCYRGGGLEDLVRQRASRALEAGADGLVASPMEIPVLRSLPACKGKYLVAPGIRPEGSLPGDQKRYSTPEEAISRGAHHIVVGRPILEAEDPVRAVDVILKEIRNAQQQFPAYEETEVEESAG